MNEEEKRKLASPDRLTGSEILLRTLLLEGVECVFGYPGGAVLYIYDAMHDNGAFRHVLTRHEQGAIHAADGYARATGRTGVCIATSGPGAANLLTGIATAMMDSIPLVVITGNVATDLMGTDAFQEADIAGMALPVTKHTFVVRRVEELARTIRAAFRIAESGRKGPVLVDIPKDVSAAVATFRYPETVDVPGLRPAPTADASALDRLAAAIETSERPLLLVGAGVIHAGAHEELGQLARAQSIPVVGTLMALGAFPPNDPLWLGMPGMHGSVAANKALLACDLLVAVGARFDDRVTMRPDGFAPQATIAHIDIDAAELGKLVPTAIAVAADAREALSGLLRRLETPGSRGDAGADSALRTAPSPAERRAAWLRETAAWRERVPLPFRSDGAFKPQEAIRIMAELSGPDAIVTTDVGQHQMWAAQYFPVARPRAFLTSGGLGTMGFGFPSAIGAQIGRPGATVVSINGDGGMQMCAQELAVCAVHNIPVKIAVLNNGVLGMIKQWQDLVYDGRHSHIELGGSPDFVKLAEAYGVKGLRATNADQARAAWKEALATDGPVLTEFVIDPDERVYPMVPQGKALADMMTGEESP